MSKTARDTIRLFDVRLQERNVTRGLLTRKDVARHLDALPDVAAKSMTLAQAEADRIARMPPPPPPQPSAPIVRAYAPPPSLDDEFDDDDLDDDDDDLDDETVAADDDDDSDEEPPAPIA